VRWKWTLLEVRICRSGLVGLAGHDLEGRLQIVLFNEHLCSTRERKREGSASIIGRVECENLVVP
jgi:hypothetical protein